MHKPANDPNDLEKYFVERANAGDVQGLVALYEPDAIVSDGEGEVAIGLDQIREFLVKFLANRSRFEPSVQAEALCSGNLALTSSRTSNGDITAEIARRQPDGSWLWVVDQFTVGSQVS
jgi:ketosteroid isomerase-like protein